MEIDIALVPTSFYLTKSFAVHEHTPKAYNGNERQAKGEYNMSTFINYNTVDVSKEFY